MLIAVAEYLLAHESMEGETFNYLCDHGELPPEKEEAPAPVPGDEPPEENLPESPDEPDRPEEPETPEEPDTPDE